LEAYHGWTLETVFSYTYPQLYLLLDARLERAAAQELEDEPGGNRRPGPDAPIEEVIRFEIYEAAQISGASPAECEKQIALIIEKVKAEKAEHDGSS
jgi:hypothetical protein